MRSLRRATQRAAGAAVACASVFLLATCDFDKLTSTNGTTCVAPCIGSLDSLDLSLSGGTTVSLGGTATLGVTSSLDLKNTVNRFKSSDATTVKIDSITGVMTGMKLGTATVTATVLAPELSGAGVSRSQSVRVRYKSIKVITPIATDSIQGLGQTRSITIQGTNAADAVQAGLLTADSIRSRDTTIVRVAGTTVTARKNGTAFLVAFFDGTLKDSVAVRVRQVAKSLTFPTTNYTARHLNFNLPQPTIILKDVADSIIPTNALVTWRTSDTTVSTIGATSGILRVKKVDTTSFYFAKMDTVERSQRITIGQVAGSITKFAGDARSDTVAKNVKVVPVVTVLDSGNTIIVGAQVKFKPATAAGANVNQSVQDTLPVTDINGRASPINWKLGDVADTNALIASSNGQTATFKVVGIPGPARKLGFITHPASVNSGASLGSSIKVAVQDSLGNTVTGATTSITLSIGNNPGGGALTGTVTASAVNGVATFSGIAIGNTGTGYTLLANGGGLQTGSSNAFDIFGAPAKLVFTTQPVGTSAGAVMSTVRIAIQDAGSNLVQNATNNVTVSIGTNPGGGTLSGTATVAAVAGVATFTTLSINNQGAGYTLNATATALTLGTSAAFTISPVGAASKLAFSVQPTNAAAAAGISPSITVRVLDVNGALVTTSSQQVTLSIDPASPTGGTLGGTVNQFAASGVATFSGISIDKVGTSYKLLASATGTSITPATSSAFNITLGTASKLGFVQQPTHTPVNTAMAPAVTVEIEDAGGNRVTTASGSVSLSLGTCSGPTLTGNGAAATSSGVATFSNLQLSSAVTGCVLSASAAGLTSATSTSFNSVTTSGATKLKINSGTPPSTAASVPTAATVQTQDANGNPVTPATTTLVTLSLTAGPSTTISGTTTANILTSQNTANFSAYTIPTAGTYRLVASATGFDPDTSASFVISPNSASKLGFLAQPSNIIAGGTFSPTIQVAVQDAGGNTITGSTNTISLTTSNANGSAPFTGVGFTATATAVNGVASFTLAQRKAGAAFKMFASSGTLTGTLSSQYDVSVAPLARLGFVVQPTNPSTINTTITPDVQVAGQDSVGNTVTDFAGTVTVATTGGTTGSTLGGTKSKAATNGLVAYNDLTIDRAGTGYQLVASASGVTNGTSNAFTIDPFVVASSVSLNDMVVLGSTVYFVGGSALKSVPVTGGSVTTITGSTNAAKITTDGTNIYWLEQGTNNNGDAFIKKYVPGGAVSTLTTGQANTLASFAERIYTDGTNVYFAARDNSGIGMAIKSVSVAAVSATPTGLYGIGTLSPMPFTLSGGFIYFYEPATNAIRRMTTGGLSLTTISTAGVTGQRFTVDGTTLFFNDGVNIKSIANASTTGAVTPTTVFTAPGTVYEVTSSAGDIYLNIAGTLQRFLASNFNTNAVLATTLSQFFYPLPISGTDMFLYDNSARIGKIPK